MLKISSGKLHSKINLRILVTNIGTANFTFRGEKADF